MEDVVGIQIRQRLGLHLELIRTWLRQFREAIEADDPLKLFEGATSQAEAALHRRDN